MGTPLIIQDKTFLPDAATIAAKDPTWPFAIDATKSNLWYPHVYMPNQNPNDTAGINAMGRWDYGPWFWPPWPVTNPPITNPNGTVSPNLPNVSSVMEAFMDTPLVNGTAYPYIEVDPKTYRFRILNAADDRFMNLTLQQATSGIVSGFTITNPGSGYTYAPSVTITGNGIGATASATVDTTIGSPTYGQVLSINIITVGSGYTVVPTVNIAPPKTGSQTTATAAIYTNPTEVGMVPAVSGSWPAGWPQMDSRAGGLPDPTKLGPDMIQIGTEGGFLPTPVVWPNTPIGYDMDPRSITIGSVKEHNLFLGPAERADVLVDFSAFAGKTLILYNDSPAPVPATDSRLDYYTDNPDLSAIGGNTPSQPGYGPNTRTIMQIRVRNTTPATSYNMAALNAAFASTATTQGVFAQSEDPIIVPQAGYNTALNGNFPADTSAYARIQSTSLTFTPNGASSPLTINLQPKAIHELFEQYYGRMNALLGVEIPFTNAQIQTTIPYGYIDLITEEITDSVTPLSPVLGDGTQIWKITHNGVDTHPIHFHLFNVQLIDRVDWAGVVKPPEPNELGWKDTVPDESARGLHCSFTSSRSQAAFRHTG